MSRACRDCQTLISRPSAQYCDDCRWRHRGKRPRYVWTPEKDAYLREHYSSVERKCGDRIGALWGWPGWAVRVRASRLGIATPRVDLGFRAWTADEVAFVQRYSEVRHIKWIARKLGRSLYSVAVKMKRMGLSTAAVRGGYSARELAMGFGVDPGTVTRWVRRGWLQAQHVGAEHDPFVIAESSVKAFVREHRSAFTLAKVDQLWFLDLMLGPNDAWRMEKSA